MKETKKCPACDSTISGNADKCPNCNMGGLNKLFLNKEDYDSWKREFLEPHIKRLIDAEKEAEKNNNLPEINLTLYKNYYGEVPPDEERKYWLTIKAKECEQNSKYAEAAEVWKEIASICQEQGKSRDVYITDHRAFLCRQLAICQQAGIPLCIFAKLPEGAPYVEILQNTLTRMADKALSQDNGKQYVQCKLLNARLCRAMGKGRDASLLEESTLRFESAQTSRSSEYYYGQVIGDASFMKLVVEEHKKDLLNDMAGK